MALNPQPAKFFASISDREPWGSKPRRNISIGFSLSCLNAKQMKG